MILNISGRCDIIAFYTPWLINRIKEGFVDVRNPVIPKKVSRIYFKDVDLFIFCTKNPLPIISYLKNIKQPIIFQITLTPYKKDIEPNVISKDKIITGIKKISKIIGKENVYVRYDPILINSNYTIEYHLKAFQKMCQLLKDDVTHIIISFIDIYKNVLNNLEYLNLHEITERDIEKIATSFSIIAKENNMTIQTCYEKDLTEFGILNEPCVSKELALKKTGKKYPKWTSRNCGCAKMADIGTYNCCNHLCKYCYANYDEKRVKENIKKHDPKSTMLLGHLENDDEIIIREK